MLSPLLPANQVQSMLAVLSACQGRHLCRPDPPKPSNESKQMLSQKIVCICVCVRMCVIEIGWVEKLHHTGTVILCRTRWTNCKRHKHGHHFCSYMFTVQRTLILYLTLIFRLFHMIDKSLWKLFKIKKTRLSLCKCRTYRDSHSC